MEVENVTNVGIMLKFFVFLMVDVHVCNVLESKCGTYSFLVEYPV